MLARPGDTKESSYSESVLCSVVDELVAGFSDSHRSVLGPEIDRWLCNLAPLDKYAAALSCYSSKDTLEDQLRRFLCILVCFTIDFNASIEDARSAFAEEDDDNLLLVLILYVQLTVAQRQGPAFLIIRRTYIIDTYLSDFCAAAKDLLEVSTLSFVTVSPDRSRCNDKASSLSLHAFLISNILRFIRPQSRADRFKFYHTQLQHIPYLMIANESVDFSLRCDMTQYVVINRLAWEKDVDSDAFLLEVLKPCLNGLRSIISQLDMTVPGSSRHLLACITLVYLVIETYDIERLFRILATTEVASLNAIDNPYSPYVQSPSYFGFAETMTSPLGHASDTQARKTLVRTRSVSNLQTHSLNMPSGDSLRAETSFTNFMHIIVIMSKIVYTQKDVFMQEDPYVFQELCRILYCSTSVLLFSLVTCLSNLSYQMLPPALPNFGYILRCGMLFAGSTILGKCSDIEYQSACLLYHLCSIAQSRLDLPGFTSADKQRSAREFFLVHTTSDKDTGLTASLCNYYGLTLQEIESIEPLPIVYADDGSLYSATLVAQETTEPNSMHTLLMASPDLSDLSKLREHMKCATRFIVETVAQYEEAIIYQSFYTKDLAIKILDPQFAQVIISISEYISVENLSDNSTLPILEDLFPSNFIKSIVILLYAYSNYYFSNFLVKSDALYSSRYNLLSLLVQLLLDLMFFLPHETVLLALLYRPDLCLLPRALLSMFKVLSYPKQIHLHVSLLLLIADLLRDFIYQLTRYAGPFAQSCNREIRDAIAAMASNQQFSGTVVQFIDELLASGWASIGRTYSVLIESLLYVLIEYLYLSPATVALLMQQTSIVKSIIKILQSIDLGAFTKLSKSLHASPASNFTEKETKSGVVLHVTAHVLEILASLLVFYRQDLFLFIGNVSNINLITNMLGIFASSVPCSPYVRTRHLPFLAYTYICMHGGKEVAHAAGSILWTYANYFLWASPLCYGFTDALLILRTNRCGFGLYCLLSYQLFTGILGRKPLDRLYSFPSAPQLKAVLRTNHLSIHSSVIDAEYYTPYSNQSDLEPLLCCSFVLDYFPSCTRNESSRLSTWQSVQVLVIPSLSVKEISDVSLPDILFSIYANERQTKWDSHLQKIRKFFAKIFCSRSNSATKVIQPFVTSCRLRDHIQYTISRTQQNAMLPVILLFILSFFTCSLKNWAYTLVGWTAAYECIPIIFAALRPFTAILRAFFSSRDSECITYKYFSILILALERILLDSEYTMMQLKTSTGTLHLFYQYFQALPHHDRKTSVSSSADTVTENHPTSRDAHLAVAGAINIGATFAVRAGYLQLLFILLDALSFEPVTASLNKAKIRPVRFLLVLGALLDNLWLSCDTAMSPELHQYLTLNVLKLRPLIVRCLAEISGFQDEYCESILVCECGDAPNFTTFRLLMHELNMNVNHHASHKVKVTGKPCTSMKLSVSSLTVGESHSLVSHSFTAQLKADDALHWILKGAWSFNQVVRSLNIVVCLRAGFEHYYMQLDDPGFHRFLENVTQCLRQLFRPTDVSNHLLTEKREKIRYYRAILLHEEASYPGQAQDTRLTLLDLIRNTLRKSVADISALGSTLLLFEVLAYTTFLSTDLCIAEHMTGPELHVLVFCLQLSLQSHAPRGVMQGVILLYAILMNIDSDNNNEDHGRVADSEHAIVAKEEGQNITLEALTKAQVAMPQGGVGLSVLLRHDRDSAPLLLSSLLIVALKYILDRESWARSWSERMLVPLVHALVQSICAKRDVFFEFVASSVYFDLINNVIGTDTLSSHRDKIKIVTTLTRAIDTHVKAEVGAFPMQYAFSTQFKAKYNILRLSIYACLYKLEHVVQKHAPNALEDIRKATAVIRARERDMISELLDNCSLVGSALDSETTTYYQPLTAAIHDYETKCFSVHAPAYLNSHDTVSILNQTTYPSQCTFGGQPDGSSALLP